MTQTVGRVSPTRRLVDAPADANTAPRTALTADRVAQFCADRRGADKSARVHDSLQMNVNTERLISEVRKRPGLWDSSHESHKDKDARHKLWAEICGTLYPTYEKESYVKKREIERAIQQRWKTARDAYMRCKNKTYGTGSKRKKYVYYKELKFLDKQRLHKLEESTSDSNASESDTSDFNTQDNIFVECQNTESNPPAQAELEQDHISEAATSTTERQRKLKTSNDDFDKEMLQLFKDNANMLKNDDLAFFMSLLPVTETFTIPQKLLFRTEVLKKAMEVSGMQNPFEASCSSSSAAAFPLKSDN